MNYTQPWKRYDRFAPVLFADGYKVSIQAGTNMYSTPRIHGAQAYSHVELGLPNRHDELLVGYAEGGDTVSQTEAVFPYVPAGVVLALIHKHGAIVDGQLPPLDFTEQ